MKEDHLFIEELAILILKQLRHRLSAVEGTRNTKYIMDTQSSIIQHLEHTVENLVDEIKRMREEA